MHQKHCVLFADLCSQGRAGSAHNGCFIYRPLCGGLCRMRLILKDPNYMLFPSMLSSFLCIKHRNINCSCNYASYYTCCLKHQCTICAAQNTVNMNNLVFWKGIILIFILSSRSQVHMYCMAWLKQQHIFFLRGPLLRFQYSSISADPQGVATPRSRIFDLMPEVKILTVQKNTDLTGGCTESSFLQHVSPAFLFTPFSPRASKVCENKQWDMPSGTAYISSLSP